MGKLFIWLIFMIVILLIFVVIVFGVVEMGDLWKFGWVGLKLLMFMLLFLGMSVVIGLVVVNVFVSGK